MKKFFLIYNKDSSSDNTSSILTDIIPAYQERGIIVIPFCLNVGEKEDFLPLLQTGGFSGVLVWVISSLHDGMRVQGEF